MEKEQEEVKAKQMISKFTSLVVKAQHKNQYQRPVNDQFQESRIKSCRKIIQRAGHVIAIPYRNQSQKQTADSLQRRDKANNSYVTTQNKQQRRTTNQLMYRRKLHIHAGMKIKPLEPYTPNSLRSRVEESPIMRRVAHAKNISQIILRIEPANRSIFQSTYKDQMSVRSHLDYTANSGILSQRSQWVHRKKF